MTLVKLKKEAVSWRKDFPIFDKKMNGKPVTFLDSAASAQKPQAVIDAMNTVMKSHYANIHRGLYAFSQETTSAFEAVRTKVQGLIGAKSENEIIFTRNTTDAINLVASSWGRANLKEGDEIILSIHEHHANIVPWQMLQEEIGFTIYVIPMGDDHTLDLEEFGGLLSPRTKFLGIVQTSNALGVINPVKEMIKAARLASPEIICLVDGSQSIVHGAVDVKDIDCDFFCFTGHKLYGPSGVGALYGKADVLADMPPYQGGGDMIETVSFKSGTTYKPAPARFEAGTPAILEVIGLGAAIDYVQNIGLAAIAEHEYALLDYTLQKLRLLKGITLYADVEPKAPVIAFNIDGAHSSDVGMILDQCGVAVRTGHHCAMPLMEALGVDSTVRASFGLYNTIEDCDRFIEALKKAKDMLVR